MTASVALPASGRAARDLAGEWLAHLVRDTRGLPVPWINRWGAEDAAATYVAPDPHVDGRQAVFHRDHGPTPDFTRQNIGRQREAMMAGLCQVCGRPVPWSRRNLVISSNTTATVALDEYDGIEVGAVTEPWLDDRCTAIATLLCPALIRRQHDDDLTVIPIRSKRDVRMIFSVGRLDTDDLAARSAPDQAAEVARVAAQVGGRPVVIWVKAVPLTHRLIRRGDAGVDR